MKYFDELKRSMEWLGQKPDTLFIGQAVAVPGTAMRNTLVDIADEKLLEFPVCEDMQMGFVNGLALSGDFVPISVFPRWNFLLLATNQIVNHLDKIADFSDYRPKVIIRTAIGSERPIHPQHQHIGDYSEVFTKMTNNIEVIRLDEPDQIFPAYEKAYLRDDGKSTILVEWGDYYNEK